jgi:hypothetical protein
VSFVKVDVDDNEAAATAAAISAVPTFQVWEGGSVTATWAGADLGRLTQAAEALAKK